MKFWRNLAYSMGNFANTIAYQVFGNRIKFFYVDVLGLSTNLYGPVWAIFGLWNAINDPLMGQLSDRTRSRWGRRVPYILFGSIPLGISFFLMWTPPARDPLILAGYLLVSVFIFDTFYTLLTVAYNALFPELTTDLKERSNLAALREGLAVIALLLSFILAPVLSESVGFVWMGVIIGVFVGVSYLMSVLWVKENPAHMEQQVIGLRDSLRYTLSSSPFRWYLGANLMKEYVFLIMASMLPFWRKYALGIQAKSQVFGVALGAGDQEAILLAVPFLLCVPLLVIWRVVTPRIGPRNAWIIANLLFIPGLTIMYFARDFYTALLGTTLIAPGLSGYMMLPIVLLTEVIEDDARRIGERREGMFFGINGGVVKLSFTVEAIFFWIVTQMTGYAPGAAAQTESAIGGIRMLMALSPLVAALLACVCLYFLRLPPQRPTVAAPALGD